MNHVFYLCGRLDQWRLGLAFFGMRHPSDESILLHLGFVNNIFIVMTALSSM